MSRYVAELSFPGAAQLTGPEVDAIAQRARRLADELGPGIEWLTCYLTEDGAYAVYSADDEDLVQAHLGRLGLGVRAVERVSAEIAATSHTGGEVRP